MATEARVLTEKKDKPLKAPQYAAKEMLTSLFRVSEVGGGHNKTRASRSSKHIDHISPIDIISLVRQGIPGNTIKSVAENFEIKLNALYDLLHITPRTAQRLMKSENLDADISDRIVQLIKIHDKCMEVFQDKEKMIRWLKTPNFALGDETPLSLLDTTDGIELVTNSLTKIEYGVFA